LSAIAFLGKYQNFLIFLGKLFKSSQIGILSHQAGAVEQRKLRIKIYGQQPARSGVNYLWEPE
jgi:hypothetical protein